MADDFNPELLRAFTLPVVFANQRHQRFRKPDEADGQRAVLQHIAHFVIPIEILTVDPHVLPHQEWVIAYAFARLNFEPIEKLIDRKRDHLIEHFVKAPDIVVRLDREAGEIDRRKAQIAAAVADFAFRVVNVRHHARAAAHVRNFGFRMPFLIVLEIVRCILKREIREQALGRRANRKLEQIIIRLAGVVVHALLYSENLNREDRRFAVAQVPASVVSSRLRIAIRASGEVSMP